MRGCQSLWLRQVSFRGGENILELGSHDDSLFVNIIKTLNYT